MKRKQYLFLIVVTVVAGLIGGAVSDWVFMAKTVVAQETQKTDRIKARFVEAESFVVYDKSGNLRAELAATSDEGVKLFFYDDDLRPTAILGMAGRNGFRGLMLNDSQGRIRISASIDSDDRPIIKLFDEDGMLRAALGCTDLSIKKTGSVEKLPESSLVLFDKEGDVLRRIPGY